MSPLFLIIVTALLLLDKTGAVPFCMLCAIIHETGHIIVMKFVGADIKEIKLSPFAVDINRTNASLPTHKNIFILSAGFVFNFIFALVLYFVFRFYPEKWVGYILAGNVFVGVFNFLPLPNTDGYNILKLIFPQNITRIISLFFAILFSFFGMVILFKYKNPFLCLFGIYSLVFSLI
ncbi:MAG: hypothetical protein IJ944_01290 [Clostridia bacterium]|nr:hypothetical protein [Clostridia bacterium]